MFLDIGAAQKGSINQPVSTVMRKWIKYHSHRAILKYRRITWPRRCLPDFMVIGAQKAGTSSMHSYLAQHPQIVPSFRKEVHFFDGGGNPAIDTFKKGMPWYCSHFPIRKSGDEKAFEATPLYIFNPLAARRMARLLPKVKIVALLRNPTERAISHYFHERRRGRETLAIDEALREEEKRLAHAFQAADYKCESFVHFSYKTRGLYKDQLERYFKHFPRDQILVMASEDLFTKPRSCLRRISEFVGVDTEHKITDLTPKKVAPDKVGISSDVYHYLDEFFRPHNQALYTMLGEDLGW